MEKKVIKAKYPQGTCPVCGNGQVEIGETHEAEWCSGTQEWACPLCGASGEEGWEVVFTGKHYDVTDGDGNAVEIAPDASTPKKLYVVTCENISDELVEYTGIVGVTDDPQKAQDAMNTRFESEYKELEKRRLQSEWCSEIRVEHAANVKQASFEEYTELGGLEVCTTKVKYRVSVSETQMLS